MSITDQNRVGNGRDSHRRVSHRHRQTHSGIRRHGNGDDRSGTRGATTSSDFSVSANGQSTGVHGVGSNAWGRTASFSEFDFANGSVTVSIIVNFAFSSYKLVPNSLGLASTRSCNTVTFTLSQPANVSLVLDGLLAPRSGVGKASRIDGGGVPVRLPARDHVDRSDHRCGARRGVWFRTLDELPCRAWSCRARYRPCG